MHLRQAGCEPITMAKPIKIGFVSFLSKAADNIFSRFPSFLSCTRPVLSFVGWVPPLVMISWPALSSPLLITQPTHVLISPLQHLFNYTHRTQVMQAAFFQDAGPGHVPSLRVRLAPLFGHQAALVGTRGRMLHARPLPCTWPRQSFPSYNRHLRRALINLRLYPDPCLATPDWRNLTYCQLANYPVET